MKEVMNYLFSKDNVTTYADRQFQSLPTRQSSYEVLTEYSEIHAPCSRNSLWRQDIRDRGHPPAGVLSAGSSEAMVNIFTGADPKEALDKVGRRHGQRLQQVLRAMKIDSGEEEERWKKP